MQKQSGEKPAFRPLLLAMCLVHVLAGCASIVYKDAATTYTAAGRDLTKQINDAAATVSKEGDQQRRAKVFADAMCPIAERRLFVRKPFSGQPIFAQYLDGYPQLKAMAGCQQLIRCETNSTGDCARACFTADEGNCLVQLEENIAIDAAAAKGKAGNADLNKKAESLASSLREIELGRTGITANKLAADAIHVLGEYLDLLGALADKQTSDIDDKADKLSGRVKKLADGYASATGKELSSSAQKTRDDVQGYIGAFGKLAGDIQEISRNGKDARKIREIVVANKVDVDATIAAIKPVIEGDLLLGITMKDINVIPIRSSIQERYRKSPDEYSRMLLYDEMAKFPYSTSKDGVAGLNEVFDHLSKSHANLVSLVKNPTDEQLKAIRNEQFDQFRAIAGDVGSIIALFK